MQDDPEMRDRGGEMGPVQAGSAEPERQYTAAEVERMFKLNDVLLKARAKGISWWEATITITVVGE